jgi:hypothetical protein
MRSGFFGGLVSGVSGLLLSAAGLAPVEAQEVHSIGSRLEWFADEAAIAELRGEARQVQHQPTPREVVLVTDRPWEGNTCAYYTVFQDGDLYRLYYRGAHFDEAGGKAAHREVACYAESRDAVHWTRPDLGLVEFEGSKANNIVWDGIGSHNFTPFRDTNPECPADARYKAFGSGSFQGKPALFAFQSPDGVRWSLMRPEPVITRGAFDSQNLAFFDPQLGKYREFHRAFRQVRDIMQGTSEDFLTWSDPEFLSYPDAPAEHLYTNAILAYPRAPHLLVGFPTRFHPQRGQQTEPTFMTSRDGAVFRRWLEPLIPVDAPQDRDGNRCNYLAWGLVERPEEPDLFSIFATEAYYTGPDSRLRRFTIRVDGFVSIHADHGGGEVITVPVVFAGSRLMVNCRAPDGQLQVELQDEQGKPLDGFQLDQSVPFAADSTSAKMTWSSGAEIGQWEGKPVRLRFVLKNADLYSFRFQ